jgi:acetyl-CoA carboxylase carboxyl transferase subunit alpha
VSGLYLDFERPIAELEKRIDELRQTAGTAAVDVAPEVRALEERAEALRREIFGSLTRYQRVQLARHPKRPYTLDYVRLLTTDFFELHGDRGFADDPAIVGGIAHFDGEPLLVVGHQKGRDTKENLFRRFGMANPEGYRKALRLFDLAGRFGMPILCLVDTPGAYPGIGAEERGQAEAIARNLREMARLPVPIVVAVTGEGGSGGALAIALGDAVLMLENSVYSVISPEGCASILWRDRSRNVQAADALRLAAEDLLELGVVDEVVPEPFGGAHRDHEAAARVLGERVRHHLKALRGLDPAERIRRRRAKYRRMGVYEIGAALATSAPAAPRRTPRPR